MHTYQNCGQLLSSLSAYIDGGLSPAFCRELEKHLADCSNCRAILNTTRRTIDLLHSPVERSNLPEGMRARLFMRLRLDDYLSTQTG